MDRGTVGALAFGTPQHRAHPGDKLARAEWFGYVVVRSQLQAHEPVAQLNRRVIPDIW